MSATRFTNEDRRKIRRAYARGTRVKTLARRFDCSEQTIRYATKGQRRRNVVTVDQVLRIRELASLGVSHRAIVRIVGLSQSVVLREMRFARAGLAAENARLRGENRALRAALECAGVD